VGVLVGDAEADGFSGVVGDVEGFEGKVAEGKGGSGLKDVELAFFAFGGSLEGGGGGLVGV